MAVEYIKTKITHLRLADPVLRLGPSPLPPLGVQLSSTHPDIWLVVLSCVAARYIWLVLTQSVTQSQSLSVWAQYKQLGLRSLCWAGPARHWTSTTALHHYTTDYTNTYLYSPGCGLGSAFLFTFYTVGLPQITNNIEELRAGTNYQYQLEWLNDYFIFYNLFVS